MKTSLKNLFLILFLICSSSASIAQIQINTTLIPPVPVTMADIVDENAENIQISITNTSQEAMDIKLVIRVENKSMDFSVRSRPNAGGQCLSLEPMESVFLDGYDLETYINFQNLDYRGITEAEILRNQELYEGIYDFCVEARSCTNINQVVSNQAGSCAVMVVAFADPPIINNCGAEVDLNQTILNFNWMFNPGMATDVDLEYILRIVPFDPEIMPANDAILNATNPEFYEERFDVPMANLSIPDDLDLQENTTYAMRVTVVDLNDKLKVKNDGHSEVCVFKTGEKNMNFYSAVLEPEIQINCESSYKAENGLQLMLYSMCPENTTINLKEFDVRAQIAVLGNENDDPKLLFINVDNLLLDQKWGNKMNTDDIFCEIKDIPYLIHWFNEFNNSDKIYAVRLQIKDPGGEVKFGNEGYTNICVIKNRNLGPQPEILDLDGKEITIGELKSSFKWKLDHPQLHKREWKCEIILAYINDGEDAKTRIEEETNRSRFVETTYQTINEESVNTFNYAIKAFTGNFTPNQTWAARVQMTDETGEVILGNKGISEIVTFRLKPTDAPYFEEVCGNHFKPEELYENIKWKLDHPISDSDFKVTFRMVEINSIEEAKAKIQDERNKNYLKYKTQMGLAYGDPSSPEAQSHSLDFSKDHAPLMMDKYVPEINKVYAVQIQMEDIAGKIKLPNEGKSDICIINTFPNGLARPEILNLDGMEVTIGELKNSFKWKLDHPQLHKREWKCEIILAYIAEGEDPEIRIPVVSDRSRFVETTYQTINDESVNTFDYQIKTTPGNFTPNQTWAARVQMKDEKGEIILFDEGKSKIVTFKIKPTTGPYFDDVCDNHFKPEKLYENIKWKLDHPISDSDFKITFRMVEIDKESSAEVLIKDEDQENYLIYEAQMGKIYADPSSEEAQSSNFNFSEEHFGLLIEKLDPALNKLYAIQIQMEDVANKIDLPQDGKSEVCVINTFPNGLVRPEILSFWSGQATHGEFANEIEWKLDHPNMHETSWDCEFFVALINESDTDEQILEYFSGNTNQMVISKKKNFTILDKNVKTFKHQGLQLAKEVFPVGEWVALQIQMKDEKGEIILGAEGKSKFIKFRLIDEKERPYFIDVCDEEIPLNKIWETIKWDLNHPNVDSRWKMTYKMVPIDNKDHADSLINKTSATDYFSMQWIKDLEFADPNSDEAKAHFFNFGELTDEQKNHSFRNNQLYAIQIQMEDEENYITLPFNGTSEICIFKTKDADNDGDCNTSCSLPLPEDKESSDLVKGDTLGMGKFLMVVKEISGTKSAGFKGKAVVWTTFLNNIEVNVKFDELKVNSKKVAFEGWAKAVLEEGSKVKEDSKILDKSYVKKAIDWAGVEKSDVQEAINYAKKIKDLVKGVNYNLPLSLEKEYKGDSYQIGIMNMGFTPEQANVQLALNVDLPWGEGTADRLLSFGTQICFGPEGFQNDWLFYKLEDVTFGDYGSYQFGINGLGADLNTQNERLQDSLFTYIHWDCNGFQKFQIAGEMRFDRDEFIPIKDDKPIEDEKVLLKTFYKTSYAKGGNFIVETTMSHPFIIEGKPDYVFTASAMTYDGSDLENPDGIKFPEAYEVPKEQSLANTWQGFYAPEIAVEFKLDFLNSEEKVEARLKDVIIDKEGISVKGELLNLIDWSKEYAVSHAGISIDTFSLCIEKNDFTETKFNGKIGIPWFEEKDTMFYSGIWDDRGSQTDTANFIVHFKEEVDMPLAGKAKIQLDENSKIELVKGNLDQGKNRWAFNIKMNGHLNIDGKEMNTYLKDKLGDSIGGKVPSLDLKLSKFELDVRQDTIYNTDFALASPQHFLGGFPMSVDDIGFKMIDSKPAFHISPKLILAGDDDGIAASTKIVFKADWKNANTSMSARNYLDLVDVDVTAINIDASFSAVALKGEIEYYDDNNMEGFRGYLSVKMPMVDSVGLSAEFGTYGNKEAAFGSDDYYSYWYVDGIASFESGIPIMSGLNMYGLGGGMAYNMKLETKGGYTFGDAGGPGKKSGAKYIPKKGDYAIKLATVIGATNKEAFNMDVALTCAFNSHDGIQELGLLGSAYFMTPVEDRDDPKVHAKVDIAYNFPNKTLHGELETYLNVELGNFALQGMKNPSNHLMVDAVFHVDPDTWYYYMGTPEQPGKLGLKTPFGTPTLSSYIMMGHGIPSDPPPLPDKIESLLTGGGDSNGNNSIEAEIDERKDRSPSKTYEDASGLAFGAHFALDPEPFEVFILYAKVGLHLGFDMNISQANIECGRSDGSSYLRGINGWYGQGQTYAAVEGELGVKVKFLWNNIKAKILDFSAAMALSGGMPNPAYFNGRARVQYSILGGLVSGSSSFDLKIGEHCKTTSTDPLAGLKFIGNMIPTGTEESIWTAPEVEFLIPMNENIEIPEFSDDGVLEKIRIFQPYLNVGKIEGVDCKAPFIPSDGYYARVRPDADLEAETNYKFYVRIEADEIVNGSRIPVQRDGLRWYQDSTVLFRTGPMPENVPHSTFDYSYPVHNQNYLLKDELPNGKGKIRFISKKSNFFTVVKDNKNCEYFARFTNMQNDTSLEVPIVSNDYYQSIEYTLPELQNEEYYKLDIVRKYKGQVQNYLYTYASLNNSVMEQTTYITLETKFDSKDVSGKQNINQDEKEQGLGEYEEELVLSHPIKFGVSKFNNFKQKMNGIEESWLATATYYRESIQMETNLNEPFDYCDLHRFGNGDVKHAPFVKMKINNDNVYRKSFISDYIRNTYNALKNRNVYTTNGRHGYVNKFTMSTLMPGYNMAVYPTYVFTKSSATNFTKSLLIESGEIVDNKFVVYFSAAAPISKANYSKWLTPFDPEFYSYEKSFGLCSADYTFDEFTRFRNEKLMKNHKDLKNYWNVFSQGPYGFPPRIVKYEYKKADIPKVKGTYPSRYDVIKKIELIKKSGTAMNAIRLQGGFILYNNILTIDKISFPARSYPRNKSYLFSMDYIMNKNPYAAGNAIMMRTYY